MMAAGVRFVTGKWARRVAGILSLLVAASLVACSGAEPEGPAPRAREVTDRPSPAAEAETEAVGVLMLGRSVMAGWFDYWGSDLSEPVARDRFAITYGELESPPGIADGACRLMDEHPSARVVFFKFCFVDFSAEEDPQRQVDRMIGWVRRVAAHARESDRPLIVGTALPCVASQTDANLVATHRLFDRRLREEAAASQGSLRVFDLGGRLASADGSLRPDYAVSSDDSHLGGEGYRALDGPLFELMNEVARELSSAK